MRENPSRISKSGNYTKCIDKQEAGPYAGARFQECGIPKQSLGSLFNKSEVVGAGESEDRGNVAASGKVGDVEGGGVTEGGHKVASHVVERHGLNVLVEALDLHYARGGIGISC